MYSANSYPYSNPSSSISFINSLKHLGEENSDKYEKKNNIKPFYSQIGNNIDGARGIGSNFSNQISSYSYNNPVSSNKSDLLLYTNLGKQIYTKSYNPNYDNNTNKYDFSQSLPTKSIKKNSLNNIIDINEDINDKYYSKRKPGYNYKQDNNNNDNKNAYYNSIVTSKVGLTNLGNTCFMNTCLQNLIHSDDFIKRLVSKSDMINSHTPITFKFYNLCISMANEKKGSITPSDFKLKFGSKHSLFSGYGQNDTQEFCRFLLEDMNKELNEVKRKAAYKELNTSKKSKIECDKEFDILFKSRESSIVIDSFYGQIINIFTCKCQYQTFSFQKVLDLPLLFKNTNKSVSLIELLDDYFEEEEIQFETKCEECRKKRVHEKEIKISRPPNILILSLQRINTRTQRKNTCTLEFFEELNLKKYIDEECGHGNECNYELYGVGNHSGTINFGHYFAYIKLNEEWYEFNDSMVNKVGRINTYSNKVYTLFYKKKMKSNFWL